MHVLDADAAAIDRAQIATISRKVVALAPENVVDEDLAVEIGLGEPVGAVVELGMMAALLEPERVEIGFEMAAHPVGADQLQGADRIGRGAAEAAASPVRPPQAAPRRPAPRELPQAGPARSASSRRRIVADLAKNRRQLSSTEPGRRDSGRTARR